MEDKSYEAPTVKILGEVSDLTETKPGIYFDLPGSNQGNTNPPPPGAPGTVS